MYRQKSIPFLEGPQVMSHNNESYMMEWFDGNPKNEERVGRIVYLDNCGKIRLGEHLGNGDVKNCFGVVSTHSSNVRNACVSHWNKKYLCDDYGRVLYKNVYRWKNKKGTLMETSRKPSKHTTFEKVCIKQLNPEYDATIEYEGRHTRQEWTPICIRGFVPTKITKHDEVRDTWIVSTMINDTENIRTVFVR